MIIFYADSVNDAYQKLNAKEFNEDIRGYLLSNRNCIDKNNILNHFELDAYDVHIQSNDLITQSSRLAIAFKTVILDEFDKMFNSLTSNISFESEKLNYSEINLKINTFKENLKILRKEYSLTQRELAKQLNLSEETIKNYEAGRREPTGKILCKLSIFFKVNPIEFIGLSLENDIDDNIINLEFMDIGTKIRNQRKKMNLSQIELAQLLHIDQTAVSQWETGRTKPSMNSLIELAEILECEISDLVGIDKNQRKRKIE